ncbi:hypothetical protein PT277_05180 [Acetobacteraceae bacterium ESL0709]|nr:hypothetical protein [Acetobacteraceae bacterium ESL0697]MDF7678088.1 hypothetical protein [Acetobacteraceae bacterium ESL0709]
MTEIDPNALPLAIGKQALNHIVGTQINPEGVASLALFPLKVLGTSGGKVAKMTISTTPAQPGHEQPATLTVYTEDGNSYTVDFTIPPGAQGLSISDVEYEQDNVQQGEVSTLKLTLGLDSGVKLPPIEVRLPPGKDSVTVTDTSVTQEPVEAGKSSKVTVTATHSDGSKAVYSYDAPPGAPGTNGRNDLYAGNLLDYPLDQNWDTTGHLNGGDALGARLDYAGGIQTAWGVRDSYGGDSYAFYRYKSAGTNRDPDNYPNVELRLRSNPTAGEPATLSLAQWSSDPSKAAEHGFVMSPDNTESGKIRALGVDKGNPPEGSIYLVDENNVRTYLPPNLIGGAWIGNGQKAMHWLIQDSNGDLLGAPRTGDDNAPPNWTRYPSEGSLESKLVQSVPANPSSDLHLNNAVYNRGLGLAVLPNGMNWQFFYPTDQTVHALTYSDADARATTIRTLKNGFGGHPQLIVQNDGSNDFNGASIESVQDEINRAQAAEAQITNNISGLASALHDETARAQNAESRLLQSVPANPVSDLRLANAVYNRGSGLAVLPEGAGNWEFFYPIEQTVHALTYSDADARATTIRTLKNGFGGHPQLIVQNDGSNDFNGASIESVQDETARAQAAESKLVQSVPANPSSDLYLNNAVYNRGVGLAVLPNGMNWQFFYPTDQTVHALTYSDLDARPTTIRTIKNIFDGHPWLALRHDGFQETLLPTRDTINDLWNQINALPGQYLKTANNTSAPTKIQAFTVTASHGQVISFPESFSGTPVVTLSTIGSDGAYFGMTTATFDSGALPNNSNFKINIAGTNGIKAPWGVSNAPVYVIAVGPA